MSSDTQVMEGSRRGPEAGTVGGSFAPEFPGLSGGEETALSSLMVLEEVFGEMSLRRARRALRGYASVALGRAGDAKALEAAGRSLRCAPACDLPLEDRDRAELMEEVRRFQWIEAERAGRDIWRERSRQDPEGEAFAEWFRHHFAKWYLARRGVEGRALER